VKHHSLDEIRNQARACAETLARAPERLQQLRPLFLSSYDLVVMTGCGSSQHLAKSAAWYWREVLGREVIALPASELFQRPQHYLDDGTRPLVFAISRTGATSETVRAVERLRADYGAATVAITGEPQTIIGSACDLEISFEESREYSVAMTQAFTSLLYGLCLFGDGLAEGRDEAVLARIPHMLSSALGETETLVKPIAENLSFTRFIYLGGGTLWAVASEAALKMTEMALETSVEHRTLEFRHGPKAILDETALVTIYPSEEDGPYLGVLLDEIFATGATVLYVGDPPTTEKRLLTIKLGLGEPDRIKPILFAHIGQELAYWRAVARGCNPDLSRHLTRTVTLQPQ
jgi:glutamine---fructose-6-phosphate transaminase (isomerizing)